MEHRVGSLSWLPKGTTFPTSPDELSMSSGLGNRETHHRADRMLKSP